MAKMQLTKNEKYTLLAITEEEVARAIAAVKAGESVEYESAEGRITLTDGVMTIAGFRVVPQLFGVIEADGSYGWRATFTEPLKALVKRVVVEEGVEELVTTFRNFNALTEIQLPQSLVRMYNAFRDCDKLNFPTLPAGLKVFHTDMNWADTSLSQRFVKWPKEIVLPAGMEDIGQTFAYSPIRSIVLSPAMQVVPNHAFYRCKALEQVTLAEGCREIEKDAFGGCTALRSIHFPASLAEIDSYAFNWCTALSDVTFAGDPVIYKYAFQNAPCEELILRRDFNHTETIPYCEDMGAIPQVDLMMKTLAGKPFLEQSEHFTVAGGMQITSYSYGKEDGGESRQIGKPLALCKDVEKLILLDGVIVGVVIDGVPVIEGKTTCTYYASEDDGAGTRERADYATLIFREEPSNE